MSKHTPEPWTHHFASIMAGGSVDTFDGSVLGTIARCENLEYSDGEGRTWSASGNPDVNAARIVACVNACTGIPTSALSEGCFLETIEALKQIKKEANTMAHASRLTGPPEYHNERGQMKAWARGCYHTAKPIFKIARAALAPFTKEGSDQ